ncbi:MAG: hypothetical protein LBT40_10520 [Deltaproteobacteria bacterium]|jgi:large subunit ribosomal protein L22|nr:hypothetical protein [Deltaproteobacteria bacterium]
MKHATKTKLPKKEKIALQKERRKRFFYAIGKYLKCPASKAIVRARTLRGLPVELAQALLDRSPTNSARLIGKVLKSATSNALNHRKVQERVVEGLSIEWIQVGQAPVLKRHHPVSHGTAKKILKRSCHIAVQLRYDEPPAGGFPDGKGSVRRRLADPTGRGLPPGTSGAARSSRSVQVRSAADE